MAMPDQRVYLAALKGEEHEVTDSAFSLGGEFSFEFSRDGRPGIYRVYLGDINEPVMYDRPLRTFDFVFDHGDIKLRTDFIDPAGDMKVLLSDENRTYYNFIHARKEFGDKISNLLSLLNRYDTTDSFYDELAAECVRVQREMNDSLFRLQQQVPESFVSSLINMYPEPVFYPGEGKNSGIL